MKIQVLRLFLGLVLLLGLGSSSPDTGAMGRCGYAFTPVPEPSILGLLGVGGIAFLVRRHGGKD